MKGAIGSSEPLLGISYTINFLTRKGLENIDLPIPQAHANCPTLPDYSAGSP
jgi:hypothetical protein